MKNIHERYIKNVELNHIVNAGGYGEGDGGYGEGDYGYCGDGIVKVMVKVSAVVVEVMTNQTAFLEQRSI